MLLSLVAVPCQKSLRGRIVPVSESVSENIYTVKPGIFVCPFVSRILQPQQICGNNGPRINK